MRNRILEVTAALGIGAVIGLVVFAFWISNDGDDEGPTPTTSTLPATGPLDPTELIVAYGRSREATYALTGQIVRTVGDRQTTFAVRRANDQDRSLDEVGPVVLVTRGDETRQCEVIEQQLLCSDPTAQASVAQEVQSFAAPMLSAEPTHDVYDFVTAPPPDLASIATLGDIECWTLLARERDGVGPVGDETTLCFESASAVLVGSITQSGDRTEVFRTLTLELDVDASDFEPSGS